MTKYNQSQYWVQVLRLKEGKRQALEAATEPQEQCFNQNPEYTHYPQTVFTQADLGHGKEEARQIQDIYAQLGKITFSPLYVVR